MNKGSKYQEAKKVVEKLRRLNPKWTVERLGEEAQYSSGFYCTLKYKSPEGLSITLTSGYVTGNSNERANLCTVEINQEETENTPAVEIFNERFYSQDVYRSTWSPHREGNRSSWRASDLGNVDYDAWKCLDEYLEKILTPILKQREEEKNYRIRKQQNVLNEFWNR